MPTGPAGTVSALLIGIGSSVCALPLASVVETMRPLAIEPVQGGPAFVAGLSIVRGEPIPVVRLSALAGIEDADVHRFVTIRADGRAVALAVERVIGVRRLDAAALRDAPPLLGDLRPDIVSRLGTLDGALLMVLDTGRLLTEATADVSATDAVQP